MYSQKEILNQETLGRKLFSGYYINGDYDNTSNHYTPGSFKIMQRKIHEDLELFTSTSPFKEDRQFIDILNTLIQINPNEYFNVRDSFVKLNRYFIKLQRTRSYTTFESIAEELALKTDKRRTNLCDERDSYTNNESIVQSFRQLNQEYLISELNEVRGDGNCYYYAVINTHIDKIITSEDSVRAQLFNHLATVFETYVLAHNTVFANRTQSSSSLSFGSREKIENICHIFRDAAANKKWTHLQEFWHEKERLMPDIVLALRYTLAQIVESNRTMDLEGLSLYDSINIVYGDNGYNLYKQNIVTMETDAEGPAVDLRLLPSALGIDLNMYFVDRRGLSVINKATVSPFRTRDIPILQESLLLRPGHYDGLIMEQDELPRYLNQMRAPYKGFNFNIDKLVTQADSASSSASQEEDAPVGSTNGIIQIVNSAGDLSLVSVDQNRSAVREAPDPTQDQAQSCYTAIMKMLITAAQCFANMGIYLVNALIIGFNLTQQTDNQMGSINYYQR